MATQNTLAIKDYAAASDWMGQVADLNKRKSDLTKKVAEVVTEVSEMSKGDMVDDLVKFATQVLETGNAIFDAMEGIQDTVSNLLKSADDFVDGVKTSIKTNLSKLFN